jgi:ADP-dependent NAD(P)H-hydrate dehydratase
MSVFLNIFLPDTDPLSKLQLVDRGLNKQSATASASPYKLIEEEDIRRLFKTRMPFSHKGTYGHALIIAGEMQTMGAAMLSAKGCLYGGSGLTTLSIPEGGLTALNSTLPEVMFLERKQLIKMKSLKKYNAVAIGPGIGKLSDSMIMLKGLFALQQPIIADADALGLLAEHEDLLSHLPKDSILSPHVKEFDGLFGKHNTWWDRLQTARMKARELGAVIVLKNQFTFIIDQKGEVMINQTGNPAMAQGGMGDVLTGLIAAYVAQGYSAKAAAILACYFHGKAGDELSAHRFNITASELAQEIPKTVKRFMDFKPED